MAEDCPCAFCSKMLRPFEQKVYVEFGEYDEFGRQSYRQLFTVCNKCYGANVRTSPTTHQPVIKEVPVHFFVATSDNFDSAAIIYKNKNCLKGLSGLDSARAALGSHIQDIVLPTWFYDGRRNDNPRLDTIELTEEQARLCHEFFDDRTKIIMCTAAERSEDENRRIYPGDLDGDNDPCFSPDAAAKFVGVTWHEIKPGVAQPSYHLLVDVVVSILSTWKVKR